ncbi:MAG: electron transfer flavoprotein subunit beta/FixA family protein [Candidatus Binatia bacterium]
MRIVVCAKEVLDPDAVNSYALEGRLVIGDDGRTLTQTTIPRLINAYDEQALEAALRLRDGGLETHIAVVCAGLDPGEVLKHCAAMGADETVHVSFDPGVGDYHVAAVLLGAWIRSRGGADLVLCGRQASDDDQGVVPALIGEALGMPVVTVARSVEVTADGGLRVVRVTPDGDEAVELSCPAVVTISNELGEPRYPTMANKMAARRKQPTVVSSEELGLSVEETRPRAVLARQFVPVIKGDCEFISADSPAAVAERLLDRLREDKVL